jgi:hypothetical protein
MLLTGLRKRRRTFPVDEDRSPWLARKHAMEEVRRLHVGEDNEETTIALDERARR